MLLPKNHLYCVASYVHAALLRTIRPMPSEFMEWQVWNRRKWSNLWFLNHSRMFSLLFSQLLHRHLSFDGGHARCGSIGQIGFARIEAIVTQHIQVEQRIPCLWHWQIRPFECQRIARRLACSRFQTEQSPTDRPISSIQRPRWCHFVCWFHHMCR